jgi:hypothetical protein
MIWVILSLLIVIMCWPKPPPTSSRPWDLGEAIISAEQRCMQNQKDREEAKARAQKRYDDFGKDFSKYL